MIFILNSMKIELAQKLLRGDTHGEEAVVIFGSSWGNILPPLSKMGTDENGMSFFCMVCMFYLVCQADSHEKVE